MSLQLMGDFGPEPVRTQLSVCLSWELCCHFGVLKMLLDPARPPSGSSAWEGLQVTAGCGSWFGLPWLPVWAPFPLVSQGHMFLPVVCLELFLTQDGASADPHLNGAGLAGHVQMEV